LRDSFRFYSECKSEQGAIVNKTQLVQSTAMEEQKYILL
jgi:hypothetical protein